MGFYGTVLKRKKVQTVEIPDGWQLRVSNFALEPVASKESTSVYAQVSDGEASRPHLLCSLDSSRCSQYQSSLIFSESDSPVRFHSDGPGVIHLVGCFEKDLFDQEGENDSETEESDEESSDNPFMDIMELVSSADTREKSEIQISSAYDEDGELRVQMLDDDNENSEEIPKLINQTTEAANGHDAEAAESESCGDESQQKVSKNKRKRERKKQKLAAEVAKEQLKESFGNGGSDVASQDSKNEPVIVPVPKAVNIGNGLTITDKVIGSGKVATPGKQVKILYEGTLPNGKVFDKNFNRNSPLSFRVGLGTVIKGMDRGIVGMKEGGHRIIHVPAALAYGRKGAGKIGPNQDLIFHIELISAGGR